MKSTLERIQAVVAARLDLPVEQVAAAQSLAELEIDSLGLIDVIFDVEKALQINIPDAAMKEIRSMDDLVRVVEGLQAGMPALQHA